MSRGNIGWQLANMNDNEHLIAGTASGYGPSPKIWSSCPVLPIMLDPTKGFVYFNDFVHAFAATGTDNQCYDGLLHTERTQGTISNAPAVPGGVIVLDAGADTVNTGITAQAVGCQCEPGANTTIYMEWRVLVTVGGGQCFMGLCCDSTTAPVASGDAIVTNKNLAGFYRDAGTGDTDWTVGVCDASSSEESDDEVSGASESVYEKFGLVLEGIGAVSGSKVTFFHNGEPVYATHDINDMPLLLMCPTFQADADGTDRPYMYLDWLRVAVHNTSTGGRDTDGS